jgi:hypothetical protein
MSRLPIFSRQLVQLQQATLYAPGIFLVPISVKAESNHRAVVQLEGLGQLKNPMTSSGIEPVTFQLVA